MRHLLLLTTCLLLGVVIHAQTATQPIEGALSSPKRFASQRPTTSK
ncbi:hypothetical protein ACQ86N_45685 [Puia sp. P3]